MRCSFLTKLCQLAFAACLALPSAVTAAPQHTTLWQAAVKPERINVYSQPSTKESVVGTLSRGQVLNVILEANVLDFVWCRIEFPGEG